MERVITFEVFKNDINEAYALGWIKDTRTRDALLRQVNSAIKFSKKNGKFSFKVNKILAKLFETELKVLLKKNRITDDAYNLITNDVEYLINNN